VNKEYKIKSKLGYTFVNGDVEMNVKNITLLSIFGLMGGFISAGFGIGGALIFNPALVLLNVHSPVASSTGVYVSMMGNVSSTIVLIFLGKLNLVYAGIVVLMSIPGSLIGLRG
jgi:uncharacterized membrane protein YfcA